MYRFLNLIVPPAIGEGPEGTPVGMMVQGRPINPRYVDGDENRIPDLIFYVNAPDNGYLTGVAAPYKYPTGAKLTYICFRNPRDVQNPNAWKIQLTIDYIDAVLGATTSIVYPFGLYAYNFNPDDVRNYIFSYRF